MMDVAFLSLWGLLYKRSSLNFGNRMKSWHAGYALFVVSAVREVKMTFLRLSVPDLAAQISTVLAEMGRPLSCDQHHNVCQCHICHEEFHLNGIYVTLQAATPTSSWFLRPLCDTCSKQLPSQTTMDFKRHHASQSFDEFCMWKQNPTNYKHLSHLRFRVLEEFCWT